MPKFFIDRESAFKTLNARVSNKWRKSNKPWVRTNGFIIFLNPNDDVISASIGELGVFEPHVTEVFKRIVRPETIVVDVGANIGWYTLLGSRLAGPRGLVVAFEPEPTSFDLLRRSMEANQFTNIRLHNACVSDIVGTKQLSLYDDRTEDFNQGRHSIVQFGRSKASISVASTTLDTALPQVPKRPHVIKIDVEGAEPLVLIGMARLMETDAQLQIIMEFNPEVWTDQNEMLNYLFRRFEVFLIARSPFFLKRISRDSLPRNAVNLYLRPRGFTGKN